jgi:hypothetical protein
MGARGPMRDPLSRRGQIEQVTQARSTLDGADVHAVPSTDEAAALGLGRLPVCPAGLPPRVAEYYDKLLADMVTARVPVEHLDEAVITQTARCLDTIDECEVRNYDKALDPKTRYAYMSLQLKAIAECGKWLERICATPGSRARIGVKPVQEKKMGELERIMKRKGQI